MKWHQGFLLVILATCSLALDDKDRVAQGVCRADKGDIVFVLDSSGSIQEQNPYNWARMLRFIQDIVDSLHVGQDYVRIGAVRFSQRATNLFYLRDTRDKESVKRKISRIQYDGLLTATGDGLEMMRNQQFNEASGDRPNVPNVAVVITDGESNMYPHKTRQQAELAHREGITVLAVGIGDKVNTAELQYISSPPHRNNVTYFTSPNFQALSNIISILDYTICSSISIERPVDTISSTTPDGIRDVTVPSGGSVTPTSIDYTGENTCPFIGDLVLVLDCSVDSSVWPQVTSFLTELVNYFSVNSNEVRVGLVRFSNSAENIWDLRRTRSREATMDGLRSLPVISGGNNIYDGLRQMRTQQFQYISGDRSWLPNVAVLVTDGKSSILQREAQTEASRARSEGVHIFTVGIGNEADINELRSLASPTAGDGRRNYFFSPSYETLANSIIPLKDRICMVFSEGTMRTPRVGFQTNTMHSGTWITPPFTTPMITDYPTTGDTDVVLVFDASNSVLGPDEINTVRFEKEAGNIYTMQQEDIVVPFVKRLMETDAITYTPVQSHVGVMCFGDWTTHHRYLNGKSFEAPYFLYNDVKRCPFVGGKANLANALEAVRTVQFTPYRGYREGVQKIVVVFLNGFGIPPQDEELLKKEAQLAYDAGIRIYAVDVSGSDKTKYAEMISMYPPKAGKTFWGAANTKTAAELASEIKDKSVKLTAKHVSEGCRTTANQALAVLMSGCLMLALHIVSSL